MIPFVIHVSHEKKIQRWFYELLKVYLLAISCLLIRNVFCRIRKRAWDGLKEKSN